MKLSFILALTGIFWVTINTASAATITAVASGNWTTHSVWSCNCQPTSSDNIVIPPGITVTSTGPIILFLGPPIKITVKGTLVLSNASLQVDSDDIISIASGGKIAGTGVTGGGVYSGVIPIFISNGSSIAGPRTITGGSLPVEVLFFKAVENGDSMLLAWASASELNFDYYEISRSLDGVTFETIGHVKGSGRSTARLDYEIVDSPPVSGILYYRLRTFDLDGKISRSDIVSAKVDRQEKTLQAFPNPVTEKILTAKLNFRPGEDASMWLLNSHGSVVYQQLLSSTEYHWTLQLTPSMERGIYFLIVRSQGQDFRKKIIIE